MQDEPIKEWLNKKNHDTTIGDTILVHTCCITITIIVTMSFSGWLAIARRGNN